MYNLPSGIYNDSYAKDQVIVRTIFQWVMLAIFLGLLIALPFFPFISSSWLMRVNNILIVLIAVHGINIVTGYCGQITLGQAAFMLLGGFTAGILSQELNIGFWPGMLAAIIMCVLIGVFFALPSVKVKELYLALSTLAAHFIIVWALIQIPLMFGKNWGVTGVQVKYASFFGVVFDTPFKFYFLALGFAILMTFIAKSIARSGLGRAFVAIRDNDKAAEATGININYYKLIAFAICSAFAGIAGCLHAYHLGWISIEAKTLTDTIWMIGMVIVGGIGTTIGAIMGTVLISLLQYGLILGSPALEKALTAFGIGGSGTGSGVLIFALGLVIALFLIFEPRGLAHLWTITKSSVRLWPFAH